MSKKRRTVSVDVEVEEYLSSEGVNASQLVNKLVKNHVSSGGDKQSMLELREEQLQSDITELERRLETKHEELDRVKQQLEEYRSDVDQTVAKAAEELSGVTLDPDNLAIKNWADKANLDPEAFIDRLEQYNSST